MTDTNRENLVHGQLQFESNSGLTGYRARLDAVNLGIGGTRDYVFDAGGFLDLVDLGANQVDFTFDGAGQLARTERPLAGEAAEFRYDGRGYLRQVTASMPGSGGPPGGDLPFLDGFEAGDVCAWSAAVGWAGSGCPETIEKSLFVLYDSAGRLHGLEPEIGDAKHVLYFAGSPIAIYGAGPEPFLTILTTDHLGTPIRAMDQAGTTTWLGGFEPFGADFTSPSAQESGIFLRFPGQWSDTVWQNASLGAGMYYNVHRWYELQVGRYSSVDPLWGRSEPYAYGYARSNPLQYSDPLGLDTVGCDAVPGVA